MIGNEAEIQAVVVDLVEGIAQDLDFDLDGSISAETQLVRDLGLASVDFIQLIVGIEQHYGRKLRFHDLLMPDGKYVDDLSIGELVTFISSKLSAPDAPSEAPVESPAPPVPPVAELENSEPVIDPAIVAAFRAKLPNNGPWPRGSGKKNARTVFVLTCPRSGSTLLRIILAGHPQLFAPPEVHLLDYADLAQRKAALDNEVNEHLLTGTIRALMHLTPCSLEEATAKMSQLEAQGLSTRDFYAILHEKLGGRLFVDKSPIYCFQPAVLRRTEDEFEEPLFIHLVRHPGGTIRSFEDAKIDALIPFMRTSGFSRRQLAELTWLVSHENAADFLQTVPAERQMIVRFEEIVGSSETTGRKLCEFLGIPFIPEMLDPYLEKERRMTDGLKVASQYSGDLKFHLHERIEPSAAERWKQYASEGALSEMTRRLAEKFGYTFPT